MGMTLEDFKDVNKNKTLLEKLQLMQQQHYYWRWDAQHSVEAKLCGNQKDADFYARDGEGMRERIGWLQSEIEAALKLHEPRALTQEELSAGYDRPVWVEWNKAYPYENEWKAYIFEKGWKPADPGFLNVAFRYWSEKPTDEQREATPWETR